jgi:diaminopimelate epimerase
MQINFLKYHGTANDFVLINQYDSPEIDLDTEQIKNICDRRFGVGADGLILLRKDNDQDFKMVYYNSDGNQSTMCGNGGRCIVQFAHDLKIVADHCTFSAIDGVHRGEILDDMVKIDMNDVDQVQREGDVFIMDTGSPHYVIKAEKNIPVQEFKSQALAIRNSEKFIDEGINVNSFFEIKKDHIKGLTFERGVEDITWSCGTGVVAMAISYVLDAGKSGKQKIRIDNLGGSLYVEFLHEDGCFKHIHLIGPATKVFEGFLRMDPPTI